MVERNDQAEGGEWKNDPLGSHPPIPPEGPATTGSSPVTPNPGQSLQGQPELDHPLNVLGGRLSRACRYVFENQGVTCMDLVYVIQGLLGQICLWEDEEDLANDPTWDEPLDLDSDDEDRSF